MLIEKEVIRPGTYWAPDVKTGVPRKLVVTPERLNYWHEQGNKMLALGLTVPVPCEHDFNAHPMTPAEKLKDNAGWVKEYRLRDNKLFSVVDIQDDEIAKKLPKTIRWTSPYFASFTDGQGNEWKDVISHLALTTRPRISEQAQFSGIAAALSLAQETTYPSEGFTLTRAGLLKQDGRPEFPVAFSLLTGAALAVEDMEDEEEESETPKKQKKYQSEFADVDTDVSMEELLGDLLCALGIKLEANSGDAGFKRALYKAAMQKINEVAQKPPVAPPPTPSAPDKPGQKKPNPIVQEQQPMYMSLEDINKIPDETMKNIALSMYNENVKLQTQLDKTIKETGSLRDAKLAEETVKRQMRVAHLGKKSPRVKADLDAMLVQPSMALSLADNGTVVDPMGATLAVLEKGLQDVPELFLSVPSVAAQPTDAEMSSEEIDQLADNYARAMGAAPERKAS